jgi:hypothetical protein
LATPPSHLIRAVVAAELELLVFFVLIVIGIVLRTGILEPIL